MYLINYNYRHSGGNADPKTHKECREIFKSSHTIQHAASYLYEYNFNSALRHNNLLLQMSEISLVRVQWLCKCHNSYNTMMLCETYTASVKRR